MKLFRLPEYKTVTRDGKNYVQRYYRVVQTNTALEQRPSGEIPSVPLPAGFISLALHATLNTYDENLNQIFRALRVFNPDKLEHLTKPELARLDTAFRRHELSFKDLYQDDDLFKQSRRLIKDITTDRQYHAARIAILKSFTRLVTGQLKQVDPEATTLLTLILSREQRWERLLAKLGETPIAPRGFRLYRGSQDEDCTKFIPIVLNAWLKNEEFEAPQNALASWSFHYDAATNFATRFGDVQNGVITGGDIPFVQVQFDKLTDGGSFLYWWSQYEAVVGTLSNDPINANPILSTILFNGEWYTYLDRFELARKLKY